MADPTETMHLDASVEDHEAMLAQKMAETNAIGTEQARVYALVEVYDVSPQEAAEMLDKPRKTVYNLLYQAEDRITEARSLCRLLNETLAGDPHPRATIVADTEDTVLYNDGEMVVAGEGDVYCTHHGDQASDETNRARCNHSLEGPDPPEPHFEAVDIVAAIEDDRDALKRATELLADKYPEDLAEIAEPLFEE